MLLSERRKDISRMNEIARILIKYGFANIVHKINIVDELHIASKYRKYRGIPEDPNVRVRLALEELGTTFIKLGQTLSTYPNIVGYDLAEELSKLQDNVPADSYDDVKGIIESEFGKPLEDIFEEFSEEPIASASIGQVHTAFLNNEFVAIKIQHKDIFDKIQTDIKLMHTLANNIDKNVSSAKSYNLPGLVDIFDRDMQKELDYYYEAVNTIHLSKLLEDDDVYIPDVYLDYSTSKVLTMEFVDGTSLKTILSSDDDTFDKTDIAYRGADTFIKQILVHGFYHADPHPGNLFILDNGKLALVDFGMVGHLDEELKENLARLFVFMLQGDSKLLLKQLYHMGILDDTSNFDEIEYEIIDILDRHYGKEFNDVSGILRNLIENNVLTEYSVIIPRDLMMVIRTITMIDDIGKSLNPSFNTTEVLKPYAMTVMSQLVKPKHIANKLTNSYLDMSGIFNKLPQSLTNIFDAFEGGKVGIALELSEINTLNIIISRIVNILVLAILTAAMLLGSSLIMLTDNGYLLFGYPFLGFLGFVFSAIMGIILMIMIIRRGNF